MTLFEHIHGQLIFAVFALFRELKVKLVSHHATYHLENHFCKGFAKTDPLASTEWQETHWVSLCTTLGSRKRVAWIKPIWQEPVGGLPLVTVVVQAIDVDSHVHIRSDCHVCYLGICGKA